VEEGREHLNFSTWTSYSAEEQAALREEIWEEVVEGEMPLPMYVPFHPDAGLGDEELRVLQRWASSARNDAD